MEALRLIAETTNHQVTIDLPPGMDGKRVEIIVLPADNELPSAPIGKRRKASMLLRGTVVLRDDLITPPISEEDWDALRMVLDTHVWIRCLRPSIHDPRTTSRNPRT